MTPQLEEQIDAMLSDEFDPEQYWPEEDERSEYEAAVAAEEEEAWWRYANMGGALLDCFRGW